MILHTTLQMMCYSIFFGVGKGRYQGANFLTLIFVNVSEQNLCVFTFMKMQKHVSGFWPLYFRNDTIPVCPFFHLAAGIIEAVGRDFFNSKVTMTVLNQSEEDERTGKKEHVVFLIKQTKQARGTGNQNHSSPREVGVCR